MQATNQGFLDLHTTSGFFLIGFCFLALTALIIVGTLFCKRIADREKEERQRMKAEMKSRADASGSV